MAITDKEKEEIHELLKQGIKITDIADQLGISRETIRKIKNAPLPDGKKADLANFNKSFEVTGEEVTAEELLKAVGSLAPKILKERLDAGALVLSICGNHAAAAGMNLEEYLKTLLLFPAELEQARIEIQKLTDINQQLQNMLDQHMDSVAITRAVDRAMAHALAYGHNQINMDVIFAYGQFLQRLKTEDPRLFNNFRMLASQPDSHTIAEASPT
ncbi:MAG: helix-turn-helix domain-containing protein [Euryarchaeota archaeon]|nr:helix-turn-helix domain-containing protein [Euryarchaeota archaeon]